MGGGWGVEGIWFNIGVQYWGSILGLGSILGSIFGLILGFNIGFNIGIKKYWVQYWVQYLF